MDTIKKQLRRSLRRNRVIETVALALLALTGAASTLFLLFLLFELYPWRL